MRTAGHRFPTAADEARKDAARFAVYSAIKGRTLVKPKACSFCGKEGEVVAHHEDYSKPLQILWLCTECHGLRHRAIGAHVSLAPDPRRQLSATHVVASCHECGALMQKRRPWQRFCSFACRWQAWKRARPEYRPRRAQLATSEDRSAPAATGGTEKGRPA